MQTSGMNLPTINRPRAYEQHISYLFVTAELQQVKQRNSKLIKIEKHETEN